MKKEEIIKKWKDSGLLDNLTEMDEEADIIKLYDPNLTQKVHTNFIETPDNMDHENAKSFMEIKK